MLTLYDRLSHLSYPQAVKLLGARGAEYIREGGKYDIDISQMARLTSDRFELRWNDAVVCITVHPIKINTLKIECSTCHKPCIHQGAALSLILEDKMSLGLSDIPLEKMPMELLSPEALTERAIADRKERAQKEKMTLTSMDPSRLWTDYTVLSNHSGKSYRVALRGFERGLSYCSCPDYRKNTLGTCKHILFALDEAVPRFDPQEQVRPYVVDTISCYIQYGQTLELRLLVPPAIPSEVAQQIEPFRGCAITAIHSLLKTIQSLESTGCEVLIYPDAEEYINKWLFKERIKNDVAAIRENPASHPLRKTLLKTELLPYQMDGIAFAVGAGRAILADDMGLGKTIQGIGVAELFTKYVHLSKVLVICPASLKSQWLLEVEKFSARSAQLILGSAEERAKQYFNTCFFTICNYEQVLRDMLSIEKVKWDLIILDEGQRIKNWEAKTSQTLKALKSPFALVLTGTPLENRLDELYSVVEFVDNRLLGPAFQFFHRYRITDEKGKVVGYQNLAELKEKLAPFLLRRTRDSVLTELPPRTTEVRRIPPTQEQYDLANAQRMIIQTILNKPYLTEMDLMRLQKALLLSRLAADSTFLVDKQPPGYSSKLKEIDCLIKDLSAEEDRKIILFSEWTTMLDMVEPIIQAYGCQFVRLDGSVPQKKRQAFVHQFQTDPDCRFFITTNAGSTGLNLQAANTVINVDLPWNPATLEQRIGRAHRMGQENPVQVFLLVTEGTIEESLLGSLAAKKELSLAVLDPDVAIDEVDMQSGMEELKQRLEILLGEKPSAPVDETMKEDVEQVSVALTDPSGVLHMGSQVIDKLMGIFIDHLPFKETLVNTTDTLKERMAATFETLDEGQVRISFRLPQRPKVGAVFNRIRRLF